MGNNNQINQPIEIETGLIQFSNRINKIQDHSNQITAISISGSQKQIATGSTDLTIKMYFIEPFKIINTIQINDVVVSLQFSMDDKKIFVGTPKRIKFYNIESSKLEQIIDGRKFDILCSTLTRDNKFLISGNVFGKIQVWDTNSYQDCFLGEQYHKQPISQIQSSTFIFASISFDALCIWKTITHECLKCYKDILNPDLINYQTLAISPNENHMAVAGPGYHISVIDLKNDYQLTTLYNIHSYQTSSVSFMNDGIHIISGNQNGQIIILNAISRNILLNIQQHSGSIKYLRFNDNQTLLFSVGQDDTMIIWSFDFLQQQDIIVQDHFHNLIYFLGYR